MEKQGRIPEQREFYGGWFTVESLNASFWLSLLQPQSFNEFTIDKPTWVCRWCLYFGVGGLTEAASGNNMHIQHH